MTQLVRTYGLQVSTIMMPASGHQSAFYDKLAATSGGLSVLLRQSPHPMDTYTRLVLSEEMALECFIPSTSL